MAEVNNPAEVGVENNGSDAAGNSVSVTQTLGTAGFGKNASRKRVRVDDSWETALANLTKKFGTYLDHRKELLNMLVKRIGYDVDASEDRKNVWGEIEKLPNLELTQRFRAAELIMSHQYRVDLFFSLSSDEKLEWVKMLLDGTI